MAHSLHAQPDEGEIKFQCIWTEADHPHPGPDLIHWRRLLRQKNWIGVGADGVGYGNMSVRIEGRQFLITGTQTGALEELTPKELALVTDFDIAANTVRCTGRVKASAESMTHAALYEINPEIDAVVHIHSSRLWHGWRNLVPTTKADIPYGTPELCYDLQRLARTGDLELTPFIVMGGHPDGIITFGKTLSGAVRELARYESKLAHEDPSAS